MTSCRLETFDEGGHQIVRLQGPRVTADLLPVGARIWSLTSASSGRQWIWHRDAQLLPAIVPSGSSYDDYWAGGWEELFPNDAPGDFMGRALPDHGEWWTRTWKWEIAEQTRSRLSVRMFLDEPAANVRCEKWVTIDEQVPGLSQRYRLTNTGTDRLWFLFKQHLAIGLRPDDQLELPGGSVTAVDPHFGTRVTQQEPTPWPFAQIAGGNQLDLRPIPSAAEQHRDFLYVTDLPEGWCGIRDGRTGEALRLAFDRQVFPYTWLFASYGGWRAHYVVVLEPCTNMPKDLTLAHARGQCASLMPGETLETEVHASFN